MATPKRDTVLADLVGLKEGITKNLAGVTVMMEAKPYTGAEMASVIQQEVDLLTAVRQAHANLAHAIQEHREFEARRGHTIKAIRDLIRLMYAGDGTKLAEFNLREPQARKVMTVETLLVRAEKARATREKRNTMGKRQKERVKGDVTGVVMRPVVGSKPTT